MMKHEFEALLGKTVTSEDYDRIEYLYMNNDLFTNVEGKSQIVSLYNLFGMAGLSRMYDSMKADEIKATELVEQVKNQSESLVQLSELLRENGETIRGLRQNALPAAAIDALHYAVSALYRKRSVYLDNMAAALDAHDRAEYDRANELDCALQERIAAMESLLK